MAVWSPGSQPLPRWLPPAHPGVSCSPFPHTMDFSGDGWVEQVVKLARHAIDNAPAEHVRDCPATPPGLSV